MENDERCLIEKTKRDRVHGTGPGRRDLKPFALLGIVPDIYLTELEKLSADESVNDLGTDKYSISKQCNFRDVFNAHENYRQILLQTKDDKSVSMTSEYEYTAWDSRISNSFKEYLATIFDNVYRFRISVMSAGHELNYHIDTDTSVICRAQIALHTEGSVFDFKTKDGEHSLNMVRGGLYFINTGWPHRVVNSSENTRVVGIFGFKYDDLKDYYKGITKCM